jgi:Tat protein translocase TatB subunit
VGSVGFPEVLVILVLALLVLGPERLPGAARTMGHWVAEIRKITGTLQAEVQDVVDEVMRPVNETATVASDSFTSTFTTADSPAAAVEAEPGTAASPSLASSEAWPAQDGGARLAADVPLPPSFPAPPVDPSLN